MRGIDGVWGKVQELIEFFFGGVPIGSKHSIISYCIGGGTKGNVSLVLNLKVSM